MFFQQLSCVCVYVRACVCVCAYVRMCVRACVRLFVTLFSFVFVIYVYIYMLYIYVVACLPGILAGMKIIIII